MAFIDIPTIEALKLLYGPRDESSGFVVIKHRPLLLASVSSDGVPNLMAFGAWKAVALDPGGWWFIAYIQSSHYTYELVKKTGVFTINIPPQHMVLKARKCGSVSGRECDKFERFGLTASSSRIVDAPIVDDCAVFLECKVTRCYPLVATEFQDEYRGGKRSAFEADIVDSYGREGYADELAL